MMGKDKLADHLDTLAEKLRGDAENLDRVATMLRDEAKATRLADKHRALRFEEPT